MIGQTTMTTSNGYGYSLRIARSIQAADPSLPGVRLGLYCLAHDIPVAQVATQFSVSRMTVYNWFTGRYHPTEQHLPAIQQMLAKKAKGKTK